MGIAADDYKFEVGIGQAGVYYLRNKKLVHYVPPYRSNSGKTTRPAKYTSYDKISDALTLDNYDRIYKAVKVATTDEQWAILEPKLTAWKDMWF